MGPAKAAKAARAVVVVEGSADGKS
jgi:hypothetical protein